MSTEVSALRMRAGASAAAAALAVAVVIPMAGGRPPAMAVPALSPDVGLTSIVDDVGNALAGVFDWGSVFDDLGLLSSTTPNALAGALFDPAGLLQEEISTITSFVGSSAFHLAVVFGQTIPGDLAVAFGHLTDLDLGVAFSELAAVLQQVVTEPLGVAIGGASTLYDMAFVIPGEFLLNFGP